MDNVSVITLSSTSSKLSFHEVDDVELVTLSSETRRMPVSWEGPKKSKANICNFVTPEQNQRVKDWICACKCGDQTDHSPVQVLDADDGVKESTMCIRYDFDKTLNVTPANLQQALRNTPLFGIISETRENSPKVPDPVCLNNNRGPSEEKSGISSPRLNGRYEPMAPPVAHNNNGGLGFTCPMSPESQKKELYAYLKLMNPAERKERLHNQNRRSIRVRNINIIKKLDEKLKEEYSDNNSNTPSEDLTLHSLEDLNIKVGRVNGTVPNKYLPLPPAKHYEEQVSFEQALRESGILDEVMRARLKALAEKEEEETADDVISVGKEGESPKKNCQSAEQTVATYAEKIPATPTSPLSPRLSKQDRAKKGKELVIRKNSLRSKGRLKNTTMETLILRKNMLRDRIARQKHIRRKMQAKNTKDHEKRPKSRNGDAEEVTTKRKESERESKGTEESATKQKRPPSAAAKRAKTPSLDASKAEEVVTCDTKVGPLEEPKRHKTPSRNTTAEVEKAKERANSESKKNKEKEKELLKTASPKRKLMDGLKNSPLKAFEVAVDKSLAPKKLLEATRNVSPPLSPKKPLEANRNSSPPPSLKKPPEANRNVSPPPPVQETEGMKEALEAAEMAEKMAKAAAEAAARAAEAAATVRALYDRYPKSGKSPLPEFKASPESATGMSGSKIKERTVVIVVDNGLNKALKAEKATPTKRPPSVVLSAESAENLPKSPVAAALTNTRSCPSSSSKKVTDTPSSRRTRSSSAAGDTKVIKASSKEAQKKLASCEEGTLPELAQASDATNIEVVELPIAPNTSIVNEEDVDLKNFVEDMLELDKLSEEHKRSILESRILTSNHIVNLMNKNKEEKVQKALQIFSSEAHRASLQSPCGPPSTTSASELSTSAMEQGEQLDPLADVDVNLELLAVEHCYAEPEDECQSEECSEEGNVEGEEDELAEEEHDHEEEEEEERSDVKELGEEEEEEEVEEEEEEEVNENGNETEEELPPAGAKDVQVISTALDLKVVPVRRDTELRRSLRRNLAVAKRKISTAMEGGEQEWDPKDPKRQRLNHSVSISKKDGSVLRAFYVDNHLVLTQEHVVSFWTQSALGAVLGAQNMWIPNGQVQRLVNNPSKYVEKVSRDMVMVSDGSVTYVELWVKEHKSEFRERPLADVFATVYFWKHRHSGIEKKVLQLENIKGSTEHVEFVVLRFSPKIVVSWYSVDDVEQKTHVHMYHLAPDVQSISEISDIEAVNHYVTSLHNIEGCDNILMGCGDNKITLWNLEYGYVIQTIELSDIKWPLSTLWAKSDRGFLFTVQECMDRELRLIAINGMSSSWKKLQNYKAPSGFHNLKGVCMEKGILIAFYPQGILSWNAETGEPIVEEVPTETSYIPSGKHVIIVVQNHVVVRYALSHLITADDV